MTNSFAKFRIGALLLSATLALPALAAPKKTGSPPGPDAEVERALDQCASLLSDSGIKRYDYLSKRWSLMDLLNPDPEQNLAAQYPVLLMRNDQLDWYVANRYPRKKIKDPAYRRRTHWYYPLISSGVEETNGKQIVGHYETIARAMEYVNERAHGKRSAKMLGFVGPAGTGKTEIGNLLDIAKVSLANNDPDYFQFTFEFINLSKIRGLEALSYGATEGEVSPVVRDIGLGRSPIVLFPPSLQQKIVELATPSFREKTAAKGIQMDPLPFLHPTNKTQEVIDAIITHYKTEEGVDTVTDRDYVRWLSRHVRIMRRIYDSNKPPQIIRYLGKHPEMQTLFFTENLALSQFFGPGSALSYTYGLIPANDGKGIFVDEFFRQTPEVRDSFLDLAQNQVAQSGGAPAELLNATIYFATNDESIEEAQENGGAKAHMNRTIRLPMRHAIEPWHVIKVALMDIGRNRFLMRRIQALPDRLNEEKNQEKTADANEDLKMDDDLLPYDPQEVIPDLESGELVGPDGRYALYYRSDSGEEPVLIAPRALWMIGLAAAGTRIVTDPKAFQKANEKHEEFSTYAKYSQFFENPAERLRVLTGAVQAQPAVASELQKARDLLREGQTGIGAREIENWLSEALQMAKNHGGTLTPVLVDQAFFRQLDRGGITATPTERMKWIQMVNLIKAEFVLPALTSDVISILQGQGRAERLYDDIKMEMMALSTNRDAEYIEGEGGHRIPIDRRRLVEIYGLFREISGYDFDPGMLKDFHIQVNPNAQNQRHPSLMEAVRRYLSQREIDKTTISELIGFFEKKAVSENIRAMGNQAERQLLDYGYDRSSFIQALMFVRDQQFLIDRDRKPAKR
ncbi:MAG: hypothetical protein HC902_02165 [Calothrix sp. SM1_5_4]|nr:hypothetical protein [Calothrix sp. SM1_5_4]